MTNWFYSGQKVVCINDGDLPNQPDSCLGFWLPHEEIFVGEIYTIQRVWIDSDSWVVCSLVEKGQRMFDDEEHGYAAIRFRPLEERKTDISGFAKLLKTREKETAL
jgi:hypothetical protein